MAAPQATTNGTTVPDGSGGLIRSLGGRLGPMTSGALEHPSYKGRLA
jgi:hypothetical protein